MNNPTSLEIKTTLIDYFRFRRQWLCAPEVSWDCGLADILIDTGTEIREVEVKISKSDLYNNELKKEKHDRGVKCNRFYICAPTYLIEDAIKWCEKTEPFYGVIEYQSYLNLVIRRSAKPLNRKYYPETRKKIEMRLSSMVYDFMNRKSRALQYEKDIPIKNVGFKDLLQPQIVSEII